MAVSSWEEKYALGIREIDEQHKRLIQMIDDLNAALLAHQGQQALSQIVRRMLDYTEYHFSTEEALLRASGYPLYGAHKQEHDGFTDKARELKERVEGGRFVLTLEVLRFLRDWVSRHILEIDRKYAPHLLGAGMR